MPVKIRRRLQALSLLETTREDFKKEIHDKFGDALIDLLEKGINPIKGLAGKQAQYSDSYKKQIEGKLTFRKGKNGVYPVTPDHIESSSISFSKDGKVKKTGIRQDNTFAPGMGVGKRVSPVNLKLKGDLLNSLKIDISGKNPYVEFTDEKADWHNNVGVGPDKVKRRLLPNNTGEEFTPRLFQKILDALKAAIKKNTK